MIRKKMIDVKVYSMVYREEKVRLFNIPGTDHYYVSGKAFDSKSRKYYGGLHFSVPFRWTVDDDGNYHTITDLPDYVRQIYRMDDGQITDMLYDNTYKTILTDDEQIIDRLSKYYSRNKYGF